MPLQDAVAAAAASILSNATHNIANTSPLPEIAGLAEAALYAIAGSGFQIAPNGQWFVPVISIGALGNGNTSITGWINATGNIQSQGNFIGNGALLTGVVAGFANGSNITVNNCTANNFIGNGALVTSVNAIALGGKVESTLNVNWSNTSNQANNTTLVNGKTEANLNVNSANFANTSNQANNASLLNGQLATFYVANGQVGSFGNTTITGFINVSTTLNVAGTTALTGNITTGGFVNVAQTLNVAGITQLTGNVTTSGFINVGTTLAVAGLTTLTGNVTLSGFANVGTTVNVGTNLVVGGTVSTNGAITGNGALSTTGGTIASGNVTVTGFANISTTLNVAGNSTLTGNVTTSGFVNVGTTLQVGTGQPQLTVNSTGYLTKYSQGAPQQPTANIALANNYGLVLPGFFAPQAGVYMTVGAGAYLELSDGVASAFSNISVSYISSVGQGSPMQPTANIALAPNYGLCLPEFIAPQAGIYVTIAAGAYLEMVDVPSTTNPPFLTVTGNSTLTGNVTLKNNELAITVNGAVQTTGPAVLVHWTGNSQPASVSGAGAQILSGVVQICVDDNENPTFQPGLVITNNTNFSYSGPLLFVNDVNVSDTGDAIQVVQNGTGHAFAILNTISGNDNFALSGAGVIVSYNDVVQSPYLFVSSNVMTSGTTFTTPPGIRMLKVRMVGAGGGGAGVAPGNTTNVSCGSGGSAGGYCEVILLPTPGQIYTIVIGANGAGGAATGNNGGAATNTTIANSNPSTLATAQGGAGGLAVAVTAGAGTANAPAATPISTGGNLNTGGQAGGIGFHTSGTGFVVGGYGGSGQFGTGGASVVDLTTSLAVTVGIAATGFGAGGSAGVANNSTGAIGGTGSAGVIIWDQYT